MKAPQFREYRLQDLKYAKHNPIRRTSKEGIRTLIESMSNVGLLYPILVSEPKKVIVDGHRRASAAKELGWETIRGIIAEGDFNSIYAAVNGTSRKMGGNDALSVWLQEPEAVVPVLRARFENMSSILGVKRVIKLCKEGYSNKLYNSTMQLARYCAKEDDLDFICQVADWMIKHRVTSTVKQAMATSQPPRMILTAITKDKPLIMSVSVGD